MGAQNHPVGPQERDDAGPGKEGGVKALFITTQTADTHNLVDAWDSASEEPAIRVQFNYQQFRVDPQILEAARKAQPEVIFYIGGCKGAGLPAAETFRQLRELAPLVNVIPDAADPPWHKTIAIYRAEECFDLHVGIDGDKTSPVDLVTVTPVDWRAFKGPSPARDIRCGFSGGLGGKRSSILSRLGSKCLIRLRSDDYADHVSFLKRCRIVFNTCLTGSGQFYHVKGRAIEAGWAGAALLEFHGSPAQDWFPSETLFGYRDAEDAKEIIASATDAEIEVRAGRLSRAVRENFHPAMIYGQILEKLHLDNPLSVATA